MNLIDYVANTLDEDDEDRDYQSELLRQEFNRASRESKEAIDRIFVCLCGYRLSSFIND